MGHQRRELQKAPLFISTLPGNSKMIIMFARGSQTHNNLRLLRCHASVSSAGRCLRSAERRTTWHGQSTEIERDRNDSRNNGVVKGRKSSVFTRCSPLCLEFLISSVKLSSKALIRTLQWTGKKLICSTGKRRVDKLPTGNTDKLRATEKQTILSLESQWSCAKLLQSKAKTGNVASSSGFTLRGYAVCWPD